MSRKKDNDGVFTRKDRSGFWISWFNAQGRRRYRKTDSETLQQARAARSAELVRVEQAKTLGFALPSEDSFEAVAARFLGHQKPRLTPKSYEREKGIVANLKAHFTGTLAEITSGQVSDFVTKRLGDMSRGTVRKELISLKHLFRLACGEWEMLPRHSNPTEDVHSPEVHDERTQHLIPEQFRLVLTASPDTLRPIVALLTATGMRRSELLTCKWGYVKGNRIYLPISKNGDAKEVVLNQFAQRVLATLSPGKPADLLFPGVTGEQVSMAFHRVCKKLKIADVRLHDLRHTFATWLRQRGTELDLIASQLGHRDLRMTRRYAQVGSIQVERAVNGLDSMLGDDLSHLIVTVKQLPEGEKPASLLCYRGVTKPKELPEAVTISA